MPLSPKLQCFSYLSTIEQSYKHFQHMNCWLPALYMKQLIKEKNKKKPIFIISKKIYTCEQTRRQKISRSVEGFVLFPWICRCIDIGHYNAESRFHVYLRINFKMALINLPETKSSFNLNGDPKPDPPPAASQILFLLLSSANPNCKIMEDDDCDTQVLVRSEERERECWKPSKLVGAGALLFLGHWSWSTLPSYFATIFSCSLTCVCYIILLRLVNVVTARIRKKVSLFRSRLSRRIDIVFFG